MKKFEELTEKEILALSEEEAKKYVLLEMAEQGVKILEKPIEPNYYPKVEPKRRVYKIEGFDFYFTNRATAEHFQSQFFASKEDLVRIEYPGSNYDLRYVTDKLDKYGRLFEIKEEFFYEKDEIESIKIYSEKNKVMKEEYMALLKEYNEENEKVIPIVNKIAKTINNVIEKYNVYREMTRKFQSYLDIDTKEVAMKYFKKAFVVTDEMEKFILDNCMLNYEELFPLPLIYIGQDYDFDEEGGF